MKQLALLTGALVIGISTAAPIVKTQPDLATTSKSLNNELHNTASLLKRSPVPPRYSPTPATTRAKAPGRPLIRSPTKSSVGSPTTTRSDRVSPANSGNGPTNGRSKPTLKTLPPAEASGLLYGAGFYQTTNHDRLLPETLSHHNWKDNPEGKTITGHVSAYVKSTSIGEGSISSAIGMHKVTATVENSVYSSGCIKCTQPGQRPMVVDIAPGSGNVKVDAYNANPNLGPIKITAESDGFGETSAAATNHPI